MTYSYSYDNILLIYDELDIELLEETKQKIDNIKKILYIENNIKKTVINKPDDNYATICKLLNKITEKNYEVIKSKLFELILKINNSDIDRITNNIFNIASSNMFYSNLFSKLYKELIETNNNFYYVFEDNFILYIKKLKDIEYVDSNVDYDKYCEYIKKITALKAGLLFFTNLVKYKICSIDNIINLCKDLINIYNTEIEKNNEEYKTEILESIYIIIKETYEFLVFNSEWESIYKFILNVKEHKNTTKKIYFKCLDVLDFLKK